MKARLKRKAWKLSKIHKRFDAFFKKSYDVTFLPTSIRNFNSIMYKFRKIKKRRRNEKE